MKSETLRPGNALRTTTLVLLVAILLAFVVLQLPGVQLRVGPAWHWINLAYFILVTVGLAQVRASRPVLGIFLFWVAAQLVLTFNFPDVRLGLNAVSINRVILGPLRTLMWLSAAYVVYRILHPGPDSGEASGAQGSRYSFRNVGGSRAVVELGFIMKLALLAAGVTAAFLATAPNWWALAGPLSGVADFVLFSGLVLIGHAKFREELPDRSIPGFALLFAYVGLATAFLNLLLVLVPALDFPRVEALVFQGLSIVHSTSWYILAYLLTAPTWWRRPQSEIRGKG